MELIYFLITSVETRDEQIRSPLSKSNKMSCTDLKITDSWIKTPVTLTTLHLCFSGFSPSLIGD